jgi:hypothetical protein
MRFGTAAQIVFLKPPLPLVVIHREPQCEGRVSGYRAASQRLLSPSSCGDSQLPVFRNRASPAQREH